MAYLLELLSLWHRRLAPFRVPIVVAAALLFFGGAWWSFQSLGITPADLLIRPLALLLCMIGPSLIYGGIGLWLLARSERLSMPVGRATVVAAYAYLAEILPVPGGAIVRAGALVRAGGDLRRSSMLVLLTAILWISLAVLGAGLTVLSSGGAHGWPLLLIGSGSTVAICAWLWRRSGLAIAALTLMHRLIGILLIAVRLVFAFAALGVAIDFADTIPFVLAILLGSASSVAPAGLGLSESLAALAATASSYPPGIAFLAVGLDRFACIAGCALLAFLAQLGRRLPAGRLTLTVNENSRSADNAAR